MPLVQLVDEEIAPRIVQVAGEYPGEFIRNNLMKSTHSSSVNRDHS
jgi:hypothetical protein